MRMMYDGRWERAREDDKKRKERELASGVRKRVKLSYPHSYQSCFTTATVLAQCLDIRILFVGGLLGRYPSLKTRQYHRLRRKLGISPDYADIACLSVVIVPSLALSSSCRLHLAFPRQIIFHFFFFEIKWSRHHFPRRLPAERLLVFFNV